MSNQREEANKRKRSIIALMLQLAGADNEWEARELQFIRDIGYRMGMETHEVASIHAELDTFKLDPPKREQDRMDILYHMLFFMRVDGKVTKPEVDMVRSAGLTLGIRPELTNELIDVIKSHIGEEVPIEAMLQLIRKYLN